MAFSMIQWKLEVLISAFSKSSLNIWKFSVHVLVKPSSQDFEHYLSIVCEMSAIVQQFELSLALLLFGIGLKW